MTPSGRSSGRARPDVHSVQDRDGLRVRVARVDHHRERQLVGQRQLIPKGPLLIGARREVAVEVEADLADGDDRLLARQRRDVRPLGRGPVLRVVGVEADGGEHVGLGARQRDRRLALGPVGADRHDRRQPRRPRPRQHRRPVGAEGAVVQVRVAVDQARRLAGRPAGGIAGSYAGCVAGCLPLRVGLRVHDPSRASSCSTIERSSFVNSGDGVPSGVPGVSACNDQPCPATGVVAPRKSLSRSQLNGR